MNQILQHFKDFYLIFFKLFSFFKDLRIKEILNESSLKVIKIQDEYEKKIKNIKLKQWVNNQKLLHAKFILSKIL